jgi:acetoin utilization protein AcuB
MFVSRSMTRKVITVNPDATIFDAQELMATNRIRHLPVVVADNKLVGIVTDRDLRSALPYRFFKEGISAAERENLKNLRVKDIMTQKLITIPPAYTIQDALMVIQNSRVGALPVVDDQGKLQGILSVRDLLRAFINVLGIGQPGTLLCILVEEKVGQLKRIVDAITEMGVSFGSVLVARYWDENKRAVFPYLLTLNVAQVKKKLQAMGYELLDPMQWYIDQLPEEERPPEKPKS